MMTPGKKSAATFVRFSPLQRLLHLAVMIGFTGLAISGFSLKFSDQWWAQSFAWLVGGAAHLAWLHRCFAVVTYGCVVAHILWLFYFKLVLKGHITGPQTLFPKVQDIKDMFQHIGYFFGKRRIPRFNRFTYWEKFDYLALFLGMNTMGLTGLFLWFPTFFTSFLPGYFINLAQVLHLYEAIMAVALKFVVHILTTHLRPETFPVDKSIFSGKTTRERMMHEHPGELESIEA